LVAKLEHISKEQENVKVCSKSTASWVMQHDLAKCKENSKKKKENSRSCLGAFCIGQNLRILAKRESIED
jgi:hypothetical protein